MAATSKELTLVKELIREQGPNTERRARESSNKMSVTYIGKGDYLALLVVKIQGKKAKHTYYFCKVLDIAEEEIDAGN